MGSKDRRPNAVETSAEAPSPSLPPPRPPRPDVTLAVLRPRDARLELSIASASQDCSFELLNLSVDPAANWRNALRVERRPGADCVEADDEHVRVVLSQGSLLALGVRPNHCLLIRQVGRSGDVSTQSLFRVMASDESDSD